MLKMPKLDVKYFLLYMLLMLFFLVFIPSLAIKIFPSPGQDNGAVPYSPEIPDTVRVYITEKKAFKTIKFEDYIEGVVASEMPSSFHFEALKAQAVASRTYALGRILAGSRLCDTVHCQVYRSDNIPVKVKKAVRATEGQVLLYNGKLAAQALYFSSSAGNTENAEDVFSNPYPYLVSVSSSNEPGATHKKETVPLTIKSFTKQIKNALPELSFGSVRKSEIKVLSHTEGGRVDKIKVGSQTLSGADIRRIFSLYSTRFSIAFDGSSIIITTSGSGHGVGMSQYGANGRAKEGETFQEILSHYYQGTTISAKT